MSIDNPVKSHVKPQFQDHSFLIDKIINILRNPKYNFIEYKTGNMEECQRIGYGIGKKGNAYIVMAEDTAIELGAPETESICRALWTKDNKFIKDRLWISGNDLININGSTTSFLQFVLLQLNEETDPMNIRINSSLNLANKIPGLMTMSTPGKIWIRVHKSLINKKFSLYSLGQSIYKAYHESIPGLKGIDIIIAADNPDLSTVLKPINTSAEIISGQNHKLRLEEEGIISCDDLNCIVCDEKATCDIIKEVAAKRKKND